MVIGSIISGMFAKKAADKQAAAVDQGIQVTRQNFLDSVELMKPSIEAGDLARQAYMYELGLGQKPIFFPEGIEDLKVEAVPGAAGGGGVTTDPLRRYDGTFYDSEGRVTSTRPGGAFTPAAGGPAMPGRFKVDGQYFDTREGADNYLADLRSRGTEYGGFRETPGYQFNVSEGQKAIDRSAAARGMALSGATLKAHERFRQGLADQTYGAHLNRLAGVSGAGQAASTSTAGMYQQNSSDLANLYGQKGNALAAGQSAFGQAASSGVNNIFRGIGMLSGMGVF